MIPKGKFDFKNVAKNLAKDAGSKHTEKDCEHFWVNKHFIVKRNGNGEAEKIVHQKCAKCDKERVEQKKYSDNRIIYKN